MEWLFIIGVSFELTGALLVSASLLLPVLRRQWMEIATSGYIFPRGGPQVTDMYQFAFPLIGAVLLLVGFTLQLGGYVLEFHDDWLILGAIYIVIGTIAGGLLLVKPVSEWLLRKAQQHDPVVAAAQAGTPPQPPPTP